MIQLRLKDSTRTPEWAKKDIPYLRRLLNEAGFDAPDHVIYEAYGNWSQEVWCASWLVVTCFTAKDVKGLVEEFMEPDNPPPAAQAGE